jgi:hypothetical protein
MPTFKVKVTDIKYDTETYDDDPEPIYLPPELDLVIEGVTDKHELHDIVSDKISDETGFCHFGFVMEIISED